MWHKVLTRALSWRRRRSFLWTLLRLLSISALALSSSSTSLSGTADSRSARPGHLILSQS